MAVAVESEPAILLHVSTTKIRCLDEETNSQFQEDFGHELIARQAIPDVRLNHVTAGLRTGLETLVN